MSTSKEEKDYNEMSVSLGTMRRYLNKFEDQSDDTQMLFSRVIMALFPQAWHNIDNYTKTAYTAGYIAGKQAGKDES